MTRRRHVDKITYPNASIYVDMDLTGTLPYMGSPSAQEQIAADLDLEPHRFELTLRKEIPDHGQSAFGQICRPMSSSPHLGHRFGLACCSW
jgi:hypothetical protein